MSWATRDGIHDRISPPHVRAVGMGARRGPAAGSGDGVAGPMTVSSPTPPADGDAELQTLFHRLNNQLGVILAHAELLETKAHDDAERARATQVVTAALEAMTVSRSIRDRVSP